MWMWNEADNSFLQHFPPTWEFQRYLRRQTARKGPYCITPPVRPGRPSEQEHRITHLTLPSAFAVSYHRSFCTTARISGCQALSKRTHQTRLDQKGPRKSRRHLAIGQQSICSLILPSDQDPGHVSWVVGWSSIRKRAREEFLASWSMYWVFQLALALARRGQQATIDRRGRDWRRTQQVAELETTGPPSARAHDGELL